ncbi:MAG: formate-nitrite transporter family protein [Blastocatellia bacterium]|jgi:protein-disulfide isomerase|nr:formate-nitrite transporter family protein [Blastocatellia bacterium]
MMKRFLPFIIIGAVLLLAIGLGWMLVRSTESSSETKLPAEARPETSNSNTPSGANPPHVRGEASAPVTLEEFGDFQCPPCGGLYPELKKLEAEFGPRLRVIFRERPLIQAHEHALLAARAAEAAGLQGRFWEMHDQLYEHQKDWSELKEARTVFEDYARLVGLDMERFKRDLDGPAVETRIFLDGARAHALGFDSTPTLMLNNREVPFATLAKPDGLRAAINTALSGTGP